MQLNNKTPLTFFSLFLLELKGDFERQISEKDAEIQNQATEWHAKLNQAREEFDIQISTIKSNHTAQLANNSELHEAALSNLEREKNDILAGLFLVEKVSEHLKSIFYK